MLTGACLYPCADLTVVLNPESALHPEGFFSSNSLRFIYHAPLTVHALTPSAGPSVGRLRVRVEARMLHTISALFEQVEVDTRCRFAEAEVPATYVTPAASVLSAPYPYFMCSSLWTEEYLLASGKLADAEGAHPMAVRITVNGQQYSRAGMTPEAGDASSGDASFRWPEQASQLPSSRGVGGPGELELRPPAAIESSEPWHGPELGGTLVWVDTTPDTRGRGERNDYDCRFDRVRVPASYVPSEDAIACRSPPQLGLARNTSGRDDEQLLDAAFVQFSESINVSMDVSMTARAAALEHCKLVSTANNNATNEATDPWRRIAMRVFNESHHVHCMLTPHDAHSANVSLQVALNGQDFTPSASSGSFAYHGARDGAGTRPQLVEPLSGPSLGGLPVSVQGASGSLDVPYTCRFGAAVGKNRPALWWPALEDPICVILARRSLILMICSFVSPSLARQSPLRACSPPSCAALHHPLTLRVAQRRCSSTSLTRGCSRTE